MLFKDWKRQRKCKSKRNGVLYLQNLAKQEYYSYEIKDLKGKQRGLFKLVKSILKPEDRFKYPALSSMKHLTINLMNIWFHRLTQLEIVVDTSPSEYLMNCKQVKKFSAFERLSVDRAKKLFMKSPVKQYVSNPITTWIVKEIEKLYFGQSISKLQTSE